MYPRLALNLMISKDIPEFLIVLSPPPVCVFAGTQHLILYVLVGIRGKAACVLAKHSTNQPSPQPSQLVADDINLPSSCLLFVAVISTQKQVA